jgi:hypothetical protein
MASPENRHLRTVSVISAQPLPTTIEDKKPEIQLTTLQKQDSINATMDELIVE